MSRKSDAPSQREICERVERNSENLRNKELDLDRVADDVETVRHTLKSLDFGGTAEGTDEVERAMEDAERIAGDEFEREGKELDDKQRETEEHEVELQERSDTSEEDVREVEEAEKALKTKAATAKLKEARDAALRDVEFLAEQVRRAKEARDRSQHVQDVLFGRIQSGKRR